MSEPTPSLYERIGGQAAIQEIVRLMYERVLRDETLAPFFANTSMDHLRHMNTEFIASALDGPVQYSGAELVAVHRGRGITRAHFSSFVGHLAVALEQQGVSPTDVDAVLGRIAMFAGKITGDANVDG